MKNLKMAMVVKKYASDFVNSINAKLFLLLSFFLFLLGDSIAQCTISAPTSSSPFTRCGPGTKTITATPVTIGSTLNWYETATGGNIIATGTSYTTPVITSSTTYYVSAQSNPITYIPAVVSDYEFSTTTGSTLDPMTGATTLLSTGVDDALSSTVTIPFTFNFNNTNYTQFVASSNGWLKFGATASNSEFSNSTISTSNIPRLYPYWDDLTTGTNGGVSYTSTGTAGSRIFIIQWKVNRYNLSATGSAATMTFQAWLYEGSNKIEFRYGSMTSTLTLSSSVGLTGSASSFQSVTISSNTASNATAVDNNSTLPDNGRVYIFNTGICRSSRVPVVVNITTPAFTVTPTANNTSICESNSVNLSATLGGTTNGSYTYLWTPGDLTGQSQNGVIPSSTTSYSVTATETATGCSNTGSITINVNPRPTSITVNPSTSSVCANVATTLVASGGLLTNQTAFYEPFNTSFATSQFTLTNVAGTLTASQNSTYKKEGNSSVLLNTTNNSAEGYIASSSINLSNFTSPTLSFYHIAGLESSFGTPYDFGYVEYSTDGGTTWTTLPDASYTGSATANSGQKNKFSSTSYSDWTTQFTSSTATPGTAPATSLWKKETFNLSAYTSATNFKIRFRLTTDITITYYGWLIDSVKITGTSQAPITWSPTTYLNTSANNTTPYNGTSNAPTIYSYNTGLTGSSITYTASAAASNGCSPQTATSVLTVATIYVGDTINAPNQTLVSGVKTVNSCSKDTVRITSTATNPGSAPTYKWYSFKTKATANASTSTITVSSTSRLRVGMRIRVLGSGAGYGDFNSTATVQSITNATTFVASLAPSPAIVNGASIYGEILTNSAAGTTVTTYDVPVDSLQTGDTVRCTLLSSLSGGSCTTQPSSAVTSDPIVFNISALPTVGISGSSGTSVCNGAPNVLTANTTLSSGTVDSYEWTLNGISLGTIAAPNNTYSASSAGVYTVTAITNAGCRKTSVKDTITLTRYVITSSSGSNGTISPLGRDTINCGSNSQTYTFLPRVNYQISQVIVDGVNIGTPSSYQFSNVTANHTIRVIFTAVRIACNATADAGNDTTICTGGVVHLSGTRSGTGVSSSTWDNGGALGTFNDATNLTTDYYPSPDEFAAGSFIINLTTNEPPIVGGVECPAGSDYVVVTVIPVPSLTINGNQGFCPGGSTLLTASATLSNGTISNYKWYNSVPTQLRSTDTITISIAGDYTITVTGSNGCTTSDIARVAQYIKPTVSISGTTPICLRQLDTLTASYTSSGAVPPSGYVWYKSNTLVGGYTSLSNPISTYIIPGSTTTANGYYRVKVTDNLGCMSDTSVAFQLSYDNSAMHGVYSINNTLPISCTNYWYFNDIIGDLNSRTIDGDVTINVNPGHTETVPTGGLALGSTNLNNATDPSGGNKKIKFQKDGTGNNPALVAFVGGTGSPNAGSDGIWSLRGVDNVTIDGIDLRDSSANTGGSLMEYGFGLFKAGVTDGCQKDTIKNCTITLNRNNNTAVVSAITSAMLDGSVGVIIANCLANNVTPLTPISANGSNSRNAVYGNTIQNCNIGVGLSGYSAPSPYNLADTLNDIGGVASATGNTIINFGGGGTTAPSAGIRARNQWGLNVQYNTINNNNGTGINHANILRGIYGESGVSANVTISNNSITIKGGGTTNAVSGIDNAIGTTASNNTVTITNNTITGSYSTSTTGSWTGITNSAVATNVNISGNTVQNGSSFGTGALAGAWSGITNAATSCVNVTMSNNSLLNNTINSKGAFTGISTAAFTSSVTMNGNIISGNLKTDTVTAGHYWMNVTTSANTTTSSVTNNRIFNNTVFDTSINAMEVACINHGTVGTYSFSGNYFSNNGITGVKGSAIMTMTGFRNAAAPLNEIITNDTIRGLYITTASSSTAAHVIRGIFTNTVAGSQKTIANNLIDSFYTSSNLNAVVSGVISTNGDSIRIYKNTINNLFPGQATATNVSNAAGIRITSGAKSFIYNNMIGLDLTRAFSPAANNVINNINGLKGIEFTSSTASNYANVYFNTIHLKGGGATNFGSSGIDITSATTPLKVYLTNNIIDNNCTNSGATNYVVGIRRANFTATVDSVFTSTTNSIYAGTPGTNNLIYYKGTTPAQSLSDFQLLTINGGGLMDSASVTGATTYINAPANLHLASGYNCAKKSAGKYLIGYSSDFDGDTRNVITPDIGADEFIYNGSGREGSSTWKGFTTNWNDSTNWCGVLPTSTTDVVIPIRLSAPTISTSNNDSAQVRNVTVNNGSSLTIAYGGKLKVFGSITATNTINATKGTIELAGSAAQTIVSSVFQNKYLRNLIVNNGSGVSIGGGATDTLNLLGKLSFSGTGRTFSTNEKLTLKSSDTLTASVGDVTGNTIVGNATIERYFSNRKAWRYLALPTSHNIQTIQSSLQEGGSSNSNPYAGYGIQITGTGSGFDMQTSSPSMKTLDPATNNWVGVANTDVLKMQPGAAYMTFVRGDRSVTTAVGSSSTIVREKGKLITGDSTLSNLGTAAGQYVGVGNLYASTVDFRKLTKSNINSVYYLWDPKVGAFGAYVTCSVSGDNITASPNNTGSYSSGNYNIQSGQGFMIQTSAANASITFKESAKVDSLNLSSRSGVNAGMLRTNLYKIQNGERFIYDGVLNMYDNSFSDNIDAIDAMKLTNSGENFAIQQGNALLAIERRSGVQENDTIYYNMSQMKLASYQLEFLPTSINAPDLEAYLEDTYLNTKTPVSLLDVTNIDFTISQDAGSYASNRFRLVYKTTGALPITSIDVKARKIEKSVLVNWTVTGEISMKKYIIEKSDDGSTFIKIGEQVPTGNSNSNSIYQYEDLDVIPGINYYRIKAVEVSGKITYSKVVIIKHEVSSMPSYSVYPNPVPKDGKVSITLSNIDEGVLKVRLINQLGQLLYSSMIHHDGKIIATYQIKLPVVLSKEMYSLEITDNKNSKTSFNILY